MIKTKGRKVTRPGGMTGASNNGVKVNVPSSYFLIQPSTTAYLPRFVYWMKRVWRQEELPGLPVRCAGHNRVPGFPVRGPKKRPRVRLSLRKAAWSASTPMNFTGNPGSAHAFRSPTHAGQE